MTASTPEDVGREPRPGGSCLSVAAALAQLDASGDSAAAGAGAGAVAVGGQVCRVRKLSKKLLFVDLRQLGAAHRTAAAAEAPGAPRLGVVLKAAELGEVAVRELRHQLKLGDEVVVRGRLERDRHGAPAVVAAAVTVEVRWADAHPGRCFLPDPVPGAGPGAPDAAAGPAAVPGAAAAVPGAVCP
jgi:lysyl-tRNA synthetase class II